VKRTGTHQYLNCVKAKENVKNPTVEEHPSAETRSRSRPTPWNLTLPYYPPHADTHTTTNTNSLQLNPTMVNSQPSPLAPPVTLAFIYTPTAPGLNFHSPPLRLRFPLVLVLLCFAFMWGWFWEFTNQNTHASRHELQRVPRPS